MTICGGKSRRGDAYRLLQRGRDHMFSAFVRPSFASFGERSLIAMPVRLHGEHRISIGAKVYIGADSWLQAIGPEGCDIEPLLSIGDGTSIAGGCVLSAVREVSIGRSVLIARNVYIADHSHAFADARRPVIEQGIDRIHPVSIGDGSWLGTSVFVGHGVRIGSGAVVGANSVVLSDVPDHGIAVGAPARVIGSTVNSAEQDGRTTSDGSSSTRGA